MKKTLAVIGKATVLCGAGVLALVDAGKMIVHLIKNK